MSKPVLQYDDPTHTYKVDGVVFPSVTQVLTEAGFIDPTWYTPEGAERGKAVALITELWDKGTLAKGLVVQRHPEYVGYLAAWQKFLSERVAEIVATEERVYDATWRYAGTLDRRVRLSGCVLNSRTVLDIKTGAKAWWHRYQTAAYMACCCSMGHTVTNRMAVYLKPNGTYVCDPHDNYPHGIDVFLAALCVANEKRAHGKTGDRYGG